VHNDVYPLDEPGQFISELYHPDCMASTPMIYEAKTEGLLSAHAINTNLHLRRRPDSVLQPSHEVDVLNGTSREPGDFQEGFVEDHAFIMATDMITRALDPDAPSPSSTWTCR
jgi:hypothetical protein